MITDSGVNRTARALADALLLKARAIDDEHPQANARRANYLRAAGKLLSASSELEDLLDLPLVTPADCSPCAKQGRGGPPCPFHESENA